LLHGMTLSRFRDNIVGAHLVWIVLGNCTAVRPDRIRNGDDILLNERTFLQSEGEVPRTNKMKGERGLVVTVCVGFHPRCRWVHAL